MEEYEKPETEEKSYKHLYAWTKEKKGQVRKLRLGGGAARKGVRWGATL